MIEINNRKGMMAQDSRREMRFNRERSQSQGGGFARGPGGGCVCPNCGHREEHQPGVTCLNQKCLKCGSLMMKA